MSDLAYEAASSSKLNNNFTPIPLHLLTSIPHTSPYFLCPPAPLVVLGLEVEVVGFAESGWDKVVKVGE